MSPLKRIFMRVICVFRGHIKLTPASYNPDDWNMPAEWNLASLIDHKKNPVIMVRVNICARCGHLYSTMTPIGEKQIGKIITD